MRERNGKRRRQRNNSAENSKRIRGCCDEIFGPVPKRSDTREKCGILYSSYVYDARLTFVLLLVSRCSLLHAVRDLEGAKRSRTNDDIAKLRQDGVKGSNEEELLIANGVRSIRDVT